MTTVTAVLVSHDGARWLPRVLRHLDGLTRAPDRLVAVDAGSTDGSAALLQESLRHAQLVDAGRVGFGAAVRAALGAVAPLGSPEAEWVWLLHDDSAPAPDALEQLLAVAARAPGPAVLGPKIREWPSLRRLLEVGATVSGTGRREVGLERGEYDQGQHDAPREVLAVSTAGMLVRRDVLERIGFDDQLAVTYADLDFGWRVNRAGHAVRTVPAAVLFHADATRNARRGADLGAAARRRRDRVSAARTLLANTAGPLVPWVALRLLLGGVLRALGLLLVRAPADAWGELSALPLALRPGPLLRARRLRRSTARVPHSRVRRLLPPWWTPYRHGLDEATDVAQAYLRVLGRGTAEATGPGRTLLRPLPVLLLGVLAASLWAGRRWLLDGLGGVAAMLPPPGSAWAWWETYLSTVHTVGVGSTASAPPYLLPLALLATLTGGSAAAAVALVLVVAMPVAAWGGYRLASRALDPVPAAAAALGYVLVVAASGAVSQGRLGTLVAAAVLPWLAGSAGRLLAADGDTRRRAAWRTALWLWLAAAFVPGILAPAAVAVPVAVAALRRRGLPAGPALLPVPVAASLLVPWAVLGPLDGGWRVWLTEAGSRYPAGIAEPTPWSLLLARPAEVGGAPAWLSAGVVLLALLALVRRTTRPAVVLAWVAAVVGLGWAVVTLLLSPGAAWLGTPLVLAHGALLLAVVAGGAGLRRELAGSAFGGRQLAGTVGAAVAVASLALGATWWLAADPVQVERATLPTYMRAAAGAEPAAGTLVLRGSAESRVSFEVRRGDGPHLGEEALLPSESRERRLAELVRQLVAGGDEDVVGALAADGVEFLLVPAPADPALSAALDATPGLTAASAGQDGARAWRAETTPTSTPPEAPTRRAVRYLLVGAQLLGLLAVAVLAAPGRRSRT